MPASCGNTVAQDLRIVPIVCTKPLPPLQSTCCVFTHPQIYWYTSLLVIVDIHSYMPAMHHYHIYLMYTSISAILVKSGPYPNCYLGQQLWPHFNTVSWINKCTPSSSLQASFSGLSWVHHNGTDAEVFE